MNLVLAVQRTSIQTKKRLSLLKYNFINKMGSLYQESLGDHESATRQFEKYRSLNVIDFGVNAKREMVMIDEFSDRALFGGLTETQMEVKDIRDSKETFRK